MSLILIVSILLRLTAAAWALSLVWRRRNWRLWILMGLLVLLAVPPIILLFVEWVSFSVLITYQPDELADFATSLVLLLGIAIIARFVGRELSTLDNLSNSEERYRSTLESLQEGCQVISFDWRYIFINAAAARQSRRAKEELLGHTMMETYPGIENTEMFVQLQRCMENRALHRMENEFTYPDGAKGWFELSIEPVPEGIFILSMDITERKQREERIVYLTNMLNTIRNVNKLITREKDRDRLIQKNCDLMIERRSYETAWILLLDEKGKSQSVAHAGFGEDIAFPEQLRASDFPQCVRELLAQQSLFLVYDQPGKRHKECAVAERHSDRSIFRCKLEYEGKLYGVLGAATAIKAASDEESLGLFREICEDIAYALASIERDEKRKQAEETMRRLATIVRDSNDAIVAYDFEGRITAWNHGAELTYGYSEEEALQMNIGRLTSPGKEVEQMEFTRRLVAGEAVTSLETQRVTKNGSILDIWLTVTKLVDDNGKPIGIASTERDITKRKRMEQQLLVTDRLASIGELASGIAHEINNPLTGILGLSELILDTNVPADVREDLKTIHSEAQRTARIVQNLLTFARKQPQEKQPVNINDTISKVLELRAYEQKVSNINVITRFAPNLPEVKANAFQLQQVFINIIINAEYFMIEAHNRGTLTIATEQVANIVRISIADDGPGIVKENLLRMFSPFFTTKEVGKGTGLGLSICHGIVTEHGGRIYAESEVGKGATFIIELPIVPAGIGGTEK